MDPVFAEYGAADAIDIASVLATGALSERLLTLTIVRANDDSVLGDKQLASECARTHISITRMFRNNDYRQIACTARTTGAHGSS